MFALPICNPESARDQSHSHARYACILREISRVTAWGKSADTSAAETTPLCCMLTRPSRNRSSGMHSSRRLWKKLQKRFKGNSFYACAQYAARASICPHLKHIVFGACNLDGHSIIRSILRTQCDTMLTIYDVYANFERIRNVRQRSSTVEHRFCKAAAVGSIPTAGFFRSLHIKDLLPCPSCRFKPYSYKARGMLDLEWAVRVDRAQGPVVNFFKTRPLPQMHTKRQG